MTIPIFDYICNRNITMKISIKHSSVYRSALLSAVSVVSFIIGLVSCTSKQTFQADDVVTVIGQVVELNSDSMVCVNEVSFSESDFNKSDFTVVAFIDSSECTGCSMHLKRWAEEISTLNSFADVNVDFVMVVESRRSIDVLNSCRKEEFKFPVYADSKRLFRQNNSFVERCKKNAAFLVDFQGEIVVFGNPIRGSKVHALFMDAISEYSDNIKQGLLSGNKVYVESVKSAVDSCCFELTNVSDSTLIIKDVIASCDCISAFVTEDTIGAGEKMTVNVVFNRTMTSTAGWKLLELYIQDLEYPIPLKIRNYE